MAKYKYPRWVEFVKELPKGATGKILRFKLRQASGYFRCDLPWPVSEYGPRSQVEELPPSNDY